MADSTTGATGRVRPGDRESPLELGKGDWKLTLKRMFAEIKDDNIPLVAGGLATFWFLAIFPALIAAMGFLGLVQASPAFTEALTGGIRSMLPGQAATILTDAVENAQGEGQGALAAVLIGLAVALWSASAGMVYLQRGLNIAYDVEEDRKFFKARAVALLLILATVVLGGIASALLVFGEPIGDAIQNVLPLGTVGEILWQVVRWVLTLAAVTILFATFYYLGPNRDQPRWKWVSPGGIVATVIWILASLGFSLYVGSFGNYAETYGAMAGVVVLLLWLFLSGLAILLGAELNAELERQSEMQKRAGR